jgi:hypothetical protein
MANVAGIGTIRAYRRAIGKKQQIGVCRDLISTFRALEAVNMEE